MKKIALFFSIIISFCSYAQTGKYSVPVTKLTEIMIAKNYSVAEQDELNKYPTKLKTLDYIYSKSFEISDHKQYTAEQFEKIDVDKYDQKRKVDEYVLVFDEASGLPLVLYSFKKMEADKALLLPANEKQKDPSGKIAN